MTRLRVINAACLSEFPTLYAWLFMAAIPLWSAAASADCQPDSLTDPNPPEDSDDWLPLSGGTVVCSGYDSDGFERNGADYSSGRNNLTVNVADGATVGGDVSQGGVRLYNSSGSTITNNGNVAVAMHIIGDQGTVTNNSTGVAENAAINGAGANLENNGTITDSVYVFGTDADVTNNGTVVANLQIVGTNGRLANTQDATVGIIAVEGNGSRVTNDGIITGGMSVSGSDVTVNNNHELRASSAIADGIGVGGSGTVQNSGTVTATAFSQQSGIIGSANDSMTITNTGSVDTTGIGIGMQVSTTAPASALGTIINRGSVTTTGIIGPGLGLIGRGSVTNGASGTILTHGRDSEGIGTEGDRVEILNENSIRTKGIDSAGIDKTGDYGKITNNGTIQTDLGNSPGILVIGDHFTVNPTIINSNSIATGGYLSPGIAVNGLGHYVQTAVGSSITTAGDDADGILTKNVRVIENGGRISTRGLLSDGIQSEGPDIQIDNLERGTISVSADAGTGITVDGVNAYVANAGAIETSGLALWGVYVNGDNAWVRNDGGSITTVGSGIYITGNDAFVENLAGTGVGFIQTTQSGSHGIAIEGNDATVDNYKSIETTDSSAHGIAVTGDDVFLTNHADSEITTGLGSAIFSDGFGGYVTNDGKLFSGLGPGAFDADGIRATGAAAPTITNTNSILTFGTDSDGISVNAPAGTGIIRNSGAISTAGDNADGIELNGRAGYTVSSTGSIETEGSSAHGIALKRSSSLNFDTSITNAGDIVVRGSGAAAIRLATQAGDNSTVTNSATGTLVAASEAIWGGSGNETVRNYGTIIGDVYLSAGDDTFVRGADSTVDGFIYGGSGTIDKLLVDLGDNQVLDGEQFVEFEQLGVAGSGTLTIENSLLVGSSFFDSGTVILDSGAVLEGDASVNGGTLMGNGLVGGSLATTTGGTTAPGTSTGILSVGGDFLLDGGVLELEANGLIDTDMLDIFGDATFADGTVEVVLGFTPDPEDVLELLILGGTLDILLGFDGIVGIGAAGSDVALGTPFTVDLGGQLFTSTVTSVVPVPPAVWLFGSALLGLIGIAKGKNFS